MVLPFLGGMAVGLFVVDLVDRYTKTTDGLSTTSKAMLGGHFSKMAADHFLQLWNMLKMLY